MKNAITGFSSTGLWPFNPDVFSESDFAPSLVTDEPPPQTAAPPTVQLLTGRPVPLILVRCLAKANENKNYYLENSL